MNSLNVPMLPRFTKNSALGDIANALDKMEAHTIAITPWPEFGYKPDVSFKIAYSEDCIFLKYFVTEQEVRIVYQQPNDPVYKDSCVEFFMSFGGEKAYYNFEFNAIGTCLAAFGEDRHNRKSLPVPAIEQIQSGTLLQTFYQDGQRMISWNITIKIPGVVFRNRHLTSLKNLQCFGNFYKCGDDLKKPHYLSWNSITAPKPDFHLSAYFGSIQFD